MPYTTVEKVKSLFRDIEIEATTGTPANDTVVTTEEVDEMISEVDAEIDAKLSDHYEVPITGTESLKIIGKISRLKVAHLIKTILESTAELSDRNQEVQTNLEKKAEKMLMDVIPRWDEKCCEWVDPIMQLTDATRTEKSPKSGNLFKANTTTRSIKRGGDNW